MTICHQTRDENPNSRIADEEIGDVEQHGFVDFGIAAGLDQQVVSPMDLVRPARMEQRRRRREPDRTRRNHNNKLLLRTHQDRSPLQTRPTPPRPADDGLPVITRDRTVAELLELWRTKALPNR